MSPLKTLILTAVLPESQAISQGLHLTKVAAPLLFWQRENLALAQVGIRASRLPALAQLLATSSVQSIILAGLAGALAPDLHIGDVVLDGEPLPTPPFARPGRIHMATEIISTPAEKHRLFTQTTSLAVDMESEIVRQFARQRSAHFLHVRAISDAAGDTLDPRFLQLIDPDGRHRIGRALAMICRQPAALPAMLRLQKSSARALENLAKTVAQIVASGWPSTKE